MTAIQQNGQRKQDRENMKANRNTSQLECAALVARCLMSLYVVQQWCDHHTSQGFSMEKENRVTKQKQTYHKWEIWFQHNTELTRSK